ncbi:septation protein A [Microbaculum marinum]|uniref:Inner membrane-spanning protein YciB n=1 Tax=Microbaculum marinum TaxID=1764581 RepID=A0AAW9RWZ5_9HYPH
MRPETIERHPGPPEWVRPALEIGPLVIFFAVNWKLGIFWATGVFIPATLVSVAVSWAMLRTTPVMPLVTAVFVTVFGGLTLWLQDDTFIKMKPTIVNLLFAAMLLVGLYFRRAFLKYAFGSVFRMTEEGWRICTLRWAAFFVFLAVLNEIVWRTFSTDTWVSFKVFAIMPLTMLFAMAQLPLLKKYGLDEEEEGKAV